MGMGRDSRARRLRRALAPATKTLLLRSGMLGALRHLRRRPSVAVLRYHAICGPEGYGYADPHLCVSPGAFERHVRYLAANYDILGLPDVVRAFREHRPLPPRAVVLTFDDGYADNLVAARILQRYDATGTFYITAGCLDGGQPFWPSEIRYLVAGLPDGVVAIGSGPDRRELPLRHEGDRRAALATITRLFKSNPIRVREALRDQLRAASKVTRLPRVMLSWEELAEMYRLGMTIGAHTLTHPNLPSAGLADAILEIVGSKRLLQHELKAPITMFSYPNGGAERYYTPEIQRAVADAGFLAAATSRNGFAGYASDLYALERVQVSERLEDLVFALEVERFVMKPASPAHAAA
jgi:peptidoglycan/xylan/chitin deacetylase (PgdA/CDA1 family)